MSIRPLAALASAALLATVLAACGTSAPAEPDPVEPDPVPATECPDPIPGAFGGPAELLDSAELVGADDLPADVCAYGSESGGSIWIVAPTYDAAFPDRIAAWLEPLGWTSTDVGPWGDDETAEVNYSFTPLAGIEINQAFAHSFESQPESVAVNFGLEREFLDQFAALGEPLAIFTAYL